MSTQRTFDSGLLAGVLLMVAADAGHWLITPMSHPNSSEFAAAWTVGKIVVGVLGVLWLIRRARPRMSEERAL